MLGGPFLPAACEQGFGDNSAIYLCFKQLESLILCLKFEVAQELVDTLLAGLASQQWGRKRMCAEGIMTLASLGHDALQPHAPRLANALLGEVPGRIWDGKEKVRAWAAAASVRNSTELGAALTPHSSR